MFATDFSSYSNAALPYALAVAHQYGVKLYAAHVLSTEAYLFATPETWPALVEQHEEREQIDFARLEAHLRGVPHEVLSPVGDISDVLFRLIHDHNIDLLVLGTHGRTGLPKLLMGSVAEKIFRHCSCPVLTVGPHVPRGEKRVAEFNRILLATDFSDESLAAVPYAISLAQEHQAHLSLLHVLQEPEAGTVNLDSDTAFLVRQMEKLVPPGPDFLVSTGVLRGIWGGAGADPGIRQTPRSRLDPTRHWRSSLGSGSRHPFLAYHGAAHCGASKLPCVDGSGIALGELTRN